ncbi:hypothetical protein BWI17_11905 [Betaproteobacteria bacterium GR16-43]|nr:hypothetical protein BWI17_11905 [Betaproteobacteria bacterium GR16-43]
MALLGLAAAGCGMMPKEEPPPKPFVGTRWQVMLELPLPGEQPYVRFGDGRMEGFGGCNHINARYLQDSVGTRFIALSGMSASKRLCDPAVMATEHRILEILGSVSSYTIIVDDMQMSGSAGSLRLRALPPLVTR